MPLKKSTAEDLRRQRSVLPAEVRTRLEDVQYALLAQQEAAVVGFSRGLRGVWTGVAAKNASPDTETPPESRHGT